MSLFFINGTLFSQEKMNSNTGFILIEKLPKSTQILTLKMYPSFSYSNLSKSEFLILLDKSKAVQPESELLLNWNYSPWYSIEFTTSSGAYGLELFLGGLGILTLPNEKKGAVVFDLVEKSK